MSSSGMSASAMNNPTRPSSTKPASFCVRHSDEAFLADTCEGGLSRMTRDGIYHEVLQYRLEVGMAALIQVDGRFARILVGSALLAVLGCKPSVSQSVSVPNRLVPDEPSCSRCRIVVREITTVGDADGPGALSSLPVSIRVDSRGRFLILSEGLPQVFDPNGQFIGTIGRLGSGPGELAGGGIPVPVGGDSILVLEAENSRGSVFAPDFRFVRHVDLSTAAPTQTLSWPDSMLKSGFIHTRDLFGHTMHLVSLSGREARVIRSGGGDTGEVRPENTRGIILTSRQNGQLWTAEVPQYRLTEWNNNLRPSRTLTRSPPGWPTQKVLPVGQRKLKPPDPYVNGIIVDASGLLWVFIRTAGDKWKDAWPDVPPNAEIPMGRVEHDKLLKTIIEVIDPKTAQIVARADLGKFVAAALPGPRGAAYVPTVNGEPQLRILEFSISGR